ncbi:hypothetical protein SFRURICE_005951, partial [Spodoptera frugiperda]
GLVAVCFTSRSKREYVRRCYWRPRINQPITAPNTVSILIFDCLGGRVGPSATAEQEVSGSITGSGKVLLGFFLMFQQYQHTYIETQISTISAYKELEMTNANPTSICTYGAKLKPAAAISFPVDLKSTWIQVTVLEYRRVQNKSAVLKL